MIIIKNGGHLSDANKIYKLPEALALDLIEKQNA